MKIVFFGSDDFALAHLKALYESTHEVVMCVTQPDRPRHRGHKMVVSPIKEYAIEKEIDVFQPEDYRDPEVMDRLRRCTADLFVVIAYGRILPQAVLDIPRIYSINLHGSILPEYRGAAPINRAIIDGRTETGMTIIRMNARMDAGDIIATYPIQIGALETSQDIRERMMAEGGAFLIQTIADIEAGQARLIPQDESAVTIAAKLDKSMGVIDWNRPARELHDLIRGLQPWPGAYTQYSGKRLKLFVTSVAKTADPAQPGVLLKVDEGGLSIGTGEGVLIVAEAQLEGGRRMKSVDLARGARLEPGYQF